MTKIKELTLENFKGLHKITVSFDDDITYLIGNNGDGKTSIGLDGIQFIFQGVSEKSKDGQNPIIGKRFNFISEGSTNAKGYAILHDDIKGDIMVKRKITATSNTVEFEAPEGVVLDQNWLNDLFNYYMISPRAFTRLQPKDQTLALGIDLSQEDDALKRLKIGFTEINAQIKAFGDIGSEPEKKEYVSLTDKSNEYERIINHNKLVDKYEENILAAKKQIEKAREAIKTYEDAIIRAEQYINITPSPGNPMDQTKVLDELRNLEENNKKANEYTIWIEKNESLKKLKTSLENNKLNQDVAKQNRIDKIRSHELPFGNLEVNDDGELLLDGRYLNDNFFSTGELMTIIPILMSKIKFSESRMKYVYLQDFSLMDEVNQKKVIDYLTKEGFQIVAEVVGDKPMKDKNCIVLKQLNVVSSHEI